MSYKILFVDDDTELLEMLNQYFTLKGYQALTAENGEEAIAKLNLNPDIIILDINMPKMNGLEMCKKVRDVVSCPILFLTAKVEEQDRVNGLLLGGDDYIMKPFSLKELDARIQANLHREERQRKRNSLKYHEGLLIDYVAKKVCYNNVEMELTNLEYAIIEFLSMHPSQVFDKEMIYEQTCGFETGADSRVITVLIGRIRKKLAHYSSEEWIETVWGMGYRWKK